MRDGVVDDGHLGQHVGHPFTLVHEAMTDVVAAHQAARHGVPEPGHSSAGQCAGKLASRMSE